MNKQLNHTQRITAKDGHCFDLTIYNSLVDGPTPIIICLPAMGTPAKHYTGLAVNLTHQGISVFVADLRGIGSSSLRASRETNYGYFELVGYDIAAMVEQIRLDHPERPLFLLGHSLGGQLAVMYSGMRPDSIDGLILVASGSVYFRSWRFPQNIKVLFGSRLVKIITSIYGYFPGKRLKFAGTEARNIIKDWAHFALTGRFEPIASKFDFESSFDQPRLPILGISLDGDWFAPPEALKNLCNKLVNAHPTFHHLNQSDTPANTLHHFNWVHHSQPVIKKITAWIEQIS